MIDGTYQLSVAGRRGMAKFVTRGDALTMMVKIFGFPRQKGVGTCTDDAFSASGAVRIPFIGALKYEIDGTVRDDALEAVCKTNRGTFDISGVRVS